MAKIVPQVGDIVTWVKPESHRDYSPNPPCVLMAIHGSKPQAFMQGLKGEQITFGGTTTILIHSGVALKKVRVDTFLNAARKANLEENPNED